MGRSEEQQEEERLAKTTTTWPYKGIVFSVKRDEMELVSGKIRTRDTVVHLGAVVILPLLGEDHVVLVRQYRRAVKRILLELPAGLLEAGDTPQKRAHIELQEETGYRAGELIEFGRLLSAPGCFSEELFCFLAKDLKASPLPCDEDEAIDVVPMHLKEALKLIDCHEIVDSKTVACILKYARKL